MSECAAPGIQTRKIIEQMATPEEARAFVKSKTGKNCDGVRYFVVTGTVLATADGTTHVATDPTADMDAIELKTKAGQLGVIVDVATLQRTDNPVLFIERIDQATETDVRPKMDGSLDRLHVNFDWLECSDIGGGRCFKGGDILNVGCLDAFGGTDNETFLNLSNPTAVASAPFTMLLCLGLTVP